MYKNKMYSLTPHKLDITVDNRNRVLTVGFLPNRSLILLPKDTRSLYMSVKASLKHPTLLPLVFLYDTCLILLFTRSISNLGSSMPSSSDPSLIGL